MPEGQQGERQGRGSSWGHREGRKGLKATLVWGESWAGSGFPVTLGRLGMGGRFRSRSWPGAFWGAFLMAPQGGVEGAALEVGTHGRIALGAVEGEEAALDGRVATRSIPFPLV